MSEATIILNSKQARDRAVRWCQNAKGGTVVEFTGPRRSLPQNNLMWALLTDVARQVDWYGAKRSPDDWKNIFSASLHRETQVVPNLDGTGFVVLGVSTKKLKKPEMAALLELIYAFGAQHGVKFGDTVDEQT